MSFTKILPFQISLRALRPWALPILAACSCQTVFAAAIVMPDDDDLGSDGDFESAFYLFTGVETRFGDLSGLGYAFTIPDEDVLRGGFLELAYGGHFLNRSANRSLDRYRDTFNAQGTPLTITDDETSSWTGQIALAIHPAGTPDWLAPLYGGLSFTRAEITPKVRGTLVAPLPGLTVEGQVAHTMSYDSVDVFIGFRKIWDNGLFVDARAGYSFELNNSAGAPSMPPGWNIPSPESSAEIDSLWARSSVGWAF